MKKDSIRNITVTAMFVALTIVLSQIAIPLPFTDVPLSLATLAVFLSGAVLGPARAPLPKEFTSLWDWRGCRCSQIFPAASPVCSDPQADIFGAMLWRRFLSA